MNCQLQKWAGPYYMCMCSLHKHVKTFTEGGTTAKFKAPAKFPALQYIYNNFVYAMLSGPCHNECVVLESVCAVCSPLPSPAVRSVRWRSAASQSHPLPSANCGRTPSHTVTPSQYHSITLSHIHHHTIIHHHTLSHNDTHTITLSHTITNTHTISHIHITHTCMHTHTHTRTRTRTRTRTHTHTHTHTHCPYLSLVISPSSRGPRHSSHR